MCKHCENSFAKELNEAVDRQSELMKNFTKEESVRFLQAAGILDDDGKLVKELQDDVH